MHTPEKVFLCVPEWERPSALLAGASADGAGDLYVLGRARREGLERWMPTFDIRPDPLPSSTWTDNVRSAVPPSEWNAIKKLVAASTGRRCRVCGGRGPKWPVECHEEWAFDHNRKVQKLVALVPLCPPCHEIKHIGLAAVRGRMKNALAHMSRVTRRPVSACKAVAQSAMFAARRRSEKQWSVDITALELLRAAAARPAAEPRRE